MHKLLSDIVKVVNVWITRGVYSPTTTMAAAEPTAFDPSSATAAAVPKEEDPTTVDDSSPPETLQVDLADLSQRLEAIVNSVQVFIEE